MRRSVKNSRSSFYLAIALLGYASAGVSVETNTRLTFKTYDVPGQLQTWLTGINNDGTIVGWTTDKQANAHAFMVIGGKYRRLDVGQQPEIWGINSEGKLVGFH